MIAPLDLLSPPAPTAPQPLTAEEARSLTDRINAAAGALWRLLLEAHEREAWRALGYPSWREYAREEFTISQSRAYQLLDQGRVIAAIADAAGVEISTMVEISERAARDVAPALPEVTATIRTRVEDGEEPGAVVRAVVETTRTERKAARPAPAEPDMPEPAADAPPAHDAEPDLLAELEHAHADIARLEAEVASLSAGDLGAEVHRWAQKYAQLEGRLQQALATGSEAQRQARYQAGVLRKVREMLGVERDGQIAARLAELLQ
jgi:hypothetical protein